MNILKDFGKGILYIFVVPAYIVFLAVAAVFGVVIFFFQSLVYIVKFFTGRKMGTLSREDKEGKEIIKGKIEAMQGKSNVKIAEIADPIPTSQVPPYQAPPSQQIEHTAPIQQSQQIEYEEEPVMSRIEQKQEEKPALEEPKDGPKEEVKEEPVKEEEPEEYNPKTSKF